MYRFLNHGEDYSDLRAIDVNEKRILERRIVKGEEEVVAFAREYHEKCCVFIGRNPRRKDGTVSAITTFSFDIDPVRPPGTASDDRSHGRALQAGRIILSACRGGYLASSGNGALVIYRLPVPICEGFESFDRWLADREGYFQRLLADRGLNDIKVDHTHDAPRIVKCLGTAATKSDRAHWRVSKWIDLPSAPYRLYSGDLRLPEPDGEARTDSRSVVVHSIGRGDGPLLAVEKDGRGGTRLMSVGSVGERIERATWALARLNSERCNDYQQWVAVGMSLTELGAVGLQLWDTWSRGSAKYKEGDCATKWKTFEANPAAGDRCSLGSLFHWADVDSGNPMQSGNGNGGEQPDDYSDSLEEFMSDIAPPKWICEPFIAKEAIGFIAGLPGTMKTWLMMDLAIECARGGGNWLGLFPVTEGRVMFVDQERARTETQRRFGALMRAKGLKPADLKDRLFVKSGSHLRLDDDSSLQKFEAVLEKRKPDLLVIDSFVTSHGKEENSRTEIQMVMERVKALRNKHHCSIVFIDHESKNVHNDKELKEAPSAFRMSGSVSKPAAAEFVLTVRRFSDNTSIVHHTKSTLGLSSQPVSVTVADVENGITVTGQK